MTVLLVPNWKKEGDRRETERETQKMINPFLFLALLHCIERPSIAVVHHDFL